MSLDEIRSALRAGKINCAEAERLVNRLICEKQMETAKMEAEAGLRLEQVLAQKRAGTITAEQAREACSAIQREAAAAQAAIIAEVRAIRL